MEKPHEMLSSIFSLGFAPNREMEKKSYLYEEKNQCVMNFMKTHNSQDANSNWVQK